MHFPAANEAAFSAIAADAAAPTAIGATPPATTTAAAQATVIEVKFSCAAIVCAVITDKDATSCVTTDPRIRRHLKSIFLSVFQKTK
jgi:hypothetical protein